MSVTSDIPTSYSVYNGAKLSAYRPRQYGEPEVTVNVPDPMFQERPSSNFKLALFSCLCCLFPPAGITALVYSCWAQSAKKRGDWRLAARHGKNAKDLAIVAIAIGFFFLLLAGVLGVVFYFTYLHIHEHDHDPVTPTP